MSASFIDLVGRLLLAAVLGAVIGLEREWRQKSAGLRTNTLIALGSALFTVLSAEFVEGGGGDRSRVAAQIVTGIGFLGAGAIMREGGSVHGLTTAATIWVNAALGMAAGMGRYMMALTGAAVTLVVLEALIPLNRVLERREHGLDPHD